MAVDNYNEMDVSYILLPECYIACSISCFGLTFIYLLLFHGLIPRFVNPRFEHIRNSPKLQHLMANTITSLINGTCIGYVSMIWLSHILDTVMLEQSYIAETTRMQRFWFAFAIGYLVYDIVVYCIIGELKYNGSISYFYLIHHCISILCFVLTIISVRGRVIIIYITWLHEWTNPLIHMIVLYGYFIGDRSAYHPKLITFTGKMLYVMAIIVLRGGFGGLMAVLVFMYECPLFLRIVALFLFVVDVMMFVKNGRNLGKEYGILSTLRKSKEEALSDMQMDTRDGLTVQCTGSKVSF